MHFLQLYAREEDEAETQYDIRDGIKTSAETCHVM